MNEPSSASPRPRTFGVVSRRPRGQVATGYAAWRGPGQARRLTDCSSLAGIDDGDRAAETGQARGNRCQTNSAVSRNPPQNKLR